VSSTCARYADEPNAFNFQQACAPACSRRRPGESWAEALAAAEAKYGHRAHEIVVTAEASAAMSRPKPDPSANVAAAFAKPARKASVRPFRIMRFRTDSQKGKVRPK